MTDKTQAVIDFLLTCPAIVNGSIFFNFADIQDNNNQIQTESNDTVSNARFVDGSVQKQFTFIIYSYKSVSYNPLISISGYGDENLSDYNEVQEVIDWIYTQADNCVFPNFGEKCIVEEMEPLTDNPKLNGVDTAVNPPLAQYSVGVKITYIDTSKAIWNK